MFRSTNDTTIDETTVAVYVAKSLRSDWKGNAAICGTCLAPHFSAKAPFPNCFKHVAVVETQLRRNKESIFVERNEGRSLQRLFARNSRYSRLFFLATILPFPHFPHQMTQQPMHNKERTCVWTKHEEVDGYSTRWNGSRCKVLGGVFRDREKK